MAKAKMITVGGGYSVQFLQRARGEETAYFQAKILKDGLEVGYASNGGRGGSTMIRPATVVKEFEVIVTEAARIAGIDPETSLLRFERAGVLLDYAITKGYDRGCGQISLNEFVQGYAH